MTAYGRSSEPHGTGFGLAILREVAAAHGWEMSVDGQPVEGLESDGDGRDDAAGHDGDANEDRPSEAASGGTGARFAFRFAD